MHIVHVSVQVRPDAIDAFTAATLDNARNSMLEPGVLRFDVLQQPDDPARFLLVECYRTPADQLTHRETAHYLRWRDTVAPLMAEPRAAVKYAPVYWSAGETR